jgi:HNH endonuclease
MNTEGEKRLIQLRKLCTNASLELIERPNGHCQIKGIYLVNYYPLAKKQTLYVAGTAGAVKSPSPERAVGIASGRYNFQVDGRDERPAKTKGRRKRLWDNGSRVCHWCKQPFASFDETTLEHIIPLSRGGLDNPNNYALAHEKCNNERGNLLPHKGRAAPAVTGSSNDRT